MNMEVAMWYSVSMLVMLAGLWLQERFKLGDWLINLVFDLVLSAWCAMMRHTGDPIYRYRGRRYR